MNNTYFSRRRLFLAAIPMASLLLIGCENPSAPAANGGQSSSLEVVAPTQTSRRTVPSPTEAPPPVAPAPIPRTETGATGTTVPRATTSPAGSSGGAAKADWRISVNRGTIKGFVDRTSVANGESLRLYVTTPSKAFDAEVYRLGWYDGGVRSGDFVTAARSIAGSAQPAPTIDAQTGLISCANWQQSAQLNVEGWRTGLYVIKLAASDGDQNYIPLIVRDDKGQHDFLFEHADNTDQAYNAWGGKSLYGFNSSDAQTVSGGRAAVKVTFDRPYGGHGAGDSLMKWELNMIRWLESEGMDVAYVSDVDVHANKDFDARVKAVLQVGHNEYWSPQMREHLEAAARERGKGIGFFTGDTGGWAVRYEDSALGPRRLLVCYKDAPDPVAATDPAQSTKLWSDAPRLQSTHKLMGIGTGGPLKRSANWIAEGVETAPEFFANTGFKNGDIVPNLVGYEYDGQVTPGAGPEPLPNLRVLGRARVLPTREVPASSRLISIRSFPLEDRPIAGQMSLPFDPGEDWSIGSLLVELVTPRGAAYLQYRPGAGTARKERFLDIDYALLPLGDEFRDPGWKTISRDFIADYKLILGPVPSSLRVASLSLQGSASIGPGKLTAPDGGSLLLGLNGETPEAAGWQLIEGEGKLTLSNSGPAGARMLNVRALNKERRLDEAQTVAVKNPKGGSIIAVGSIQWSWGLDGYGDHKDTLGNETKPDRRIQLLTRNILNVMRGSD